MQSNNVSLLLLLVFSAVQALVLTPGPAARARAHVAPLGSLITMQNKGGVSFDNDMSNWRPDEQPGSKSTMSGGFESTDTPDFLPEEVDPNSPDFKEGMYGSQKQNAQKDRNMDPGVAGALEVNPDVYVPEAEEITVDTSQFVLPKSGMTDLDLDMFTAHTETKALDVDVRPVAMTYEEYYCGFTADSDPAFSVTPVSGKMERRNGPPTTVTVTCDPNGRVGKLVGYLCFILPEEKAFSTFYQITCDSQ